MSRSFCRSETRPSCLSSMVRIFLVLTFLAASAFAEENDAATRISPIEARIGGRIGVAALDTTNSEHIDYRADERFPMCSTFKFLAAAAVLKHVDEKQEKLERFVPYDAKEILEYAPVTKELSKTAVWSWAHCARPRSNRATIRRGI